jgi:polar amino acid transport system substrate-binding protein
VTSRGEISPVALEPHRRAFARFLFLPSPARHWRRKPEPATPLRIAVYDLEPYGGQSRDGLFNGASVELWRRVAEDRNWRYQLTLVPRMDDLLSGLQANTYDVAIGAITITPERLTRVDFSYPTHRSGVAAVFAKQTDAASALYEYGAAVSELGPLLFATVMFLTATGVLMWWFERSPADSASKPDSHSSVMSWHEGVYWAVVTMTTVGYGDKTPKTHVGRAIAVVWMIGSLVLVSLLTTSLIARITVSRVEGIVVTRVTDLAGKRSQRFPPRRAPNISTPSGSPIKNLAISPTH